MLKAPLPFFSVLRSGNDWGFLEQLLGTDLCVAGSSAASAGVGAGVTCLSFWGLAVSGDKSLDYA